MPSHLASGWYAARQYGFGDQKLVTAAQGFDVSAFVPLQVACNDHVNNTEALSFGISWVPFGVVAGVGDAACSYGGRYAPFGVKPAAGWHYVPNWTGDAPRRPRAMYAELTSVTYTDLLEDHAPRLIYDSEEDYRADAWQTATDLPAAHLMWRIGDSSDEGVIAARTNDPGQPQLSESWLVPEFAAYPEPPFIAMDNQYLDFGTNWGSVIKDAASDLRATNASRYQDKTYARAVVGSNGTLYLQYWFWYVNNRASVTGAFNHEGDWEFIQIRLDSSLEPEAATYSQHEAGETCDWQHVPKTTDGRPKAWPARNRHANYFENGTYPFVGPIPIPGLSDGNDGNGDQRDLDVIDVSTTPDFLKWPGRWGASLQKTRFPADTDSPHGPLHQATWDPVTAEARAKDCTVD
jgi:hypothetical protein